MIKIAFCKKKMKKKLIFFLKKNWPRESIVFKKKKLFDWMYLDKEKNHFVTKENIIKEVKAFYG